MSESQKEISRRSLFVSIAGVLTAVVSVIIALASLNFSAVALQDSRTFSFDISCGPPKFTKPDAVKEIILGLDFPTFTANGDAPQTRGSFVACTVYNLSKEPVPRLSFIVVASDMHTPTRRYRQNVIMEGFFAQSSRTLWLENSIPKVDVHLEIGNKVGYIDPFDGSSHVATIPTPLASLNLPHSATRSRSLTR